MLFTTLLFSCQEIEQYTSAETLITEMKGKDLHALLIKDRNSKIKKIKDKKGNIRLEHFGRVNLDICEKKIIGSACVNLSWKRSDRIATTILESPKNGGAIDKNSRIRITKRNDSLFVNVTTPIVYPNITKSSMEGGFYDASRFASKQLEKYASKPSNANSILQEDLQKIALKELKHNQSLKDRYIRQSWLFHHLIIQNYIIPEQYLNLPITCKLKVKDGNSRHYVITNTSDFTPGNPSLKLIIDSLMTMEV